jgi:uncharacterized protein
LFIEIEDLKQEPLHVSHVYEVSQLRLAHEDAGLSEPVCVEFTLSHRDQELQIDGTVKTAVLYKCSRCLKEFVRPLAMDYNLFYLPQPKGIRADEEIALKYEEMEISFYDGIRFDVDLMVLEQIELAMPMKFVCREDCQGLCYVCGADLNERSCGCKKEEPDSRLAALLEFRKRTNKE